jgi:hypothetical protein
MKYEKPEVVRLASALTAIRHGVAKSGICQDNEHPQQGKNATCSAYEADE